MKGRGQYADIEWSSFALEEPLFGYTHVHLMPYRITLDELHYPNLKDAVRGEDTPDIDHSGSGNIHPSRSNVAAAREYGTPQQLVLVHKVKSGAPVGPALSPGQECNGLVYEFYNAKVPAANYYPPIEPIQNPTQEEEQKQEFLKNLAKSQGCPAL